MSIINAFFLPQDSRFQPIKINFHPPILSFLLSKRVSHDHIQIFLVFIKKAYSFFLHIPYFFLQMTNHLSQLLTFFFFTVSTLFQFVLILNKFFQSVQLIFNLLVLTENLIIICHLLSQLYYFLPCIHQLIEVFL